MSKIGKKPVVIPKEVDAQITGDGIIFKGKEGTLTVPVLLHIKAELKTDADQRSLVFTTERTMKQARANWGTMAALAKNAVMGVNQGFSKTLEIEGIGFKAAIVGANLSLNVGFTNPVVFTPPAGIKIVVEKNQIKISGYDKAVVGEVAATIRRIKKPEPYKGKGIHYLGEVIRRKAGKKVAGATGA